MSFSLFGEQEGHICQVGSAGGMIDLLNFIRKTVKHGLLLDLMNTETTSDVQEAIRDITSHLPYCTNPDVKEALSNLKQGLGQIKGVAIISD
jgi:hypothetical protein